MSELFLVGVSSLAGGDDLVRELKGLWASQQGSPRASLWPDRVSRGCRSDGREAERRGGDVTIL